MLTFERAEQLLEPINGTTFAALDTLTIPVLKGGKKNPFQGKVHKVCTGHRVMLFTNKVTSGYENKVRRSLEAIGKNPDNFELGSLPWGQRVPNSPFIVNNGTYYLQCVFLKAGKTVYKHITGESPIITETHIFGNGETLDKDLIIGLPDKTGSEHQGLDRDDQVIVRTYKLENILRLSAFSETLEGTYSALEVLEG